MPQAGIITIPLEAVFIYGIGNINRLRFKIACYFFYIHIRHGYPILLQCGATGCIFAIRSLRLSEPVFNLSAIGGYGDICNGSIFRFTGAVAGHSGVAVTLGHFDSIQSFSQRTDLVYFLPG